MKLIYWIIIGYFACMIIWAAWAYFGYTRAIKDKNLRICQEAEVKRLEGLKIDYPVTLPDDKPTDDWTTVSTKDSAIDSEIDTNPLLKIKGKWPGDESFDELINDKLGQ